MCNETGIPELLESQILGIPMVVIGSFPELCIYLAFGRISFHLHYICISFAFRIAPRISIFALHFISI